MSLLQELLGSDFICDECGRRHAINLKHVEFSPDALQKLPAICREFGAKAISLLADTRTWELGGRQAEEILTTAGLSVQHLLVPDPEPGHSPVCDDVTHDQLAPLLPEADLYLAVGSGMVNDLAKWLAGDRKAPYVVVGTAVSMNGYASANVAPSIKGVKSLVRGQGPVAILGTPETLCSAPLHMTAAGLGDILAKSVSVLDWHMNRLIFDEYYCPFCSGLIDDIEPIYMGNPEGIGAGDEAGIAALFEALLLTGVGMSMAGTSSPASGGEHLISHTLDMMSSVDGVPHDLHGRQVGVSTILAAAIYEEICKIEKPVFRLPESHTDENFWGRLTAPVEEQHAKKRAKTAQAVEYLQGSPEAWDKLRQNLIPKLRTAKLIKDCLRRAGAAHRIRDLGIDRERYLAALSHAHEIRERFSMLDLARIVGILPERGEELVDRWIVE